MLDVVEYLDEHFIFRNSLVDGRIGIVVSAVVDDAIHVQVEAVELGDAVLGDELRDSGIALGEPAKEFRNTCMLSVVMDTYRSRRGAAYPWRPLCLKTAGVGVGGAVVAQERAQSARNGVKKGDGGFRDTESSKKRNRRNVAVSPFWLQIAWWASGRSRLHKTLFAPTLPAGR
jgi:hypothetical protein